METADTESNPPYRKRLVYLPIILAHENPKTAYKSAQKGSENFKPCVHNFVSTGVNFAKIWLMAVLSSQGIVVKCTDAIFFRTVDCT